MRPSILATLVLLACKPSTTPDDSATPDDTGLPPSEGDPLVYQGAADVPSFWESTDVAVVGTTAFICTGVESLGVLDVSDPAAMTHTDTLTFSWSHGQADRCTHVGAHGDTVVVTSEPDEIQPEAGLALLDVSDPTTPDVFADQTSEHPLGQASLSADRLLVAVAEAGVLPFSLTTDEAVEGQPVGDLGNVISVLALEDGALAGTTTGELHVLDAELELISTLDLGASALELLDLGDGRAAAALGSAGIAVVDVEAGELLGQTATNGTALRLARLDSGELLVTNWSDVRLYDVAGDIPELIAVDAVFEAEDQPRHFGADAAGDIVVVGEWSGVHALRFVPDTVGPEITPSTLTLQVPDDGEPYDLELGIENEGQRELEVSSLELPSGWSVNPSSLILAPGEGGGAGIELRGRHHHPGTSADGTLQRPGRAQRRDRSADRQQRRLRGRRGARLLV